MAARASAEAVLAGAPERRHMHYSVCRRFPRADPRDWRGTENPQRDAAAPQEASRCSEDFFRRQMGGLVCAAGQRNNI